MWKLIKKHDKNKDNVLDESEIQSIIGVSASERKLLLQSSTSNPSADIFFGD